MEENSKTETSKLKYVFLVVAFFLVIISLGTYAWLSYRSNDTALVLTIGEINGMSVTLKPYQINATLSPISSYTNGLMTEVEAKNNKSVSETFKLFYAVETISNELKCSDFKYKIMKSTNNWSSQTEVANGDFSNASNGNNLNIYSESIPANGDYEYKVYLWIQESGGNQSSLQGKSFTGELRAIIEKDDYYVYNGSYQTYIAKESGYYKIEAWGAQGGGSNGGKGAYTSGYINLNANEKLYLYIGGAGVGNNSTTIGGFNGGGNSTAVNGISGTSGGGATDIRLVSGSWSDEASLKSRIMVAGGGGGSNTAGCSYSSLVGANGNDSNSSYVVYQGHGGMQRSGGTIPSKHSCASTNSTAGIFGAGGIGGANQATTTTGGGSGGGGGYYGGSGSSGLCNGTWTGGGGSSFISGYAGSNAIDSTGTHTNNTIHYSNKYFINASLTANNNTGNGKVRIAYIGTSMPKTNANLNGVRYIKDCATSNTINTNKNWLEIQAIKDGNNIAKSKTVTGTGTVTSGYLYSYITDGIMDITDSTIQQFAATATTGNQCVTIDLGTTYDLDEIAVWHWFADGRTYNDNITSVSNNNSSWTTIINITEAETSIGKHVNAWN